MPQLLRDRLNAPSPSYGLWSQSGWSGPASFPQPRRPAGLSCFSPAGQKPLPCLTTCRCFFSWSSVAPLGSAHLSLRDPGPCLSMQHLKRHLC